MAVKKIIKKIEEKHGKDMAIMFAVSAYGTPLAIVAFGVNWFWPQSYEIAAITMAVPMLFVVMAVMLLISNIMES